MKIKFWSDFACPYCYIGEKRLQDAIDALDVRDQIELEPLAFELDPGAPKTVETDTVTRFAKKYAIPVAEADAQVKYITQLAKECGLDFHYAESKYTNTFDAHRLMKLAEARHHDKLHKLNFLLFDAYFTKCLELADHAVLTKVGLEAGLPEAEISAVLNSKEYGEAVRADELAAAKAGVRGVPFFVFEDGVVIPGAASQENLEEIIKRALAGAKIAGQGYGQSCGSDGCKLH